MIVETPSILWSCEDYSKGTPAALTSIDMCESGIVLDKNERRRSYVLATASSSNILNLWRVSFLDIPTNKTSSTVTANSSSSSSTTVTPSPTSNDKKGGSPAVVQQQQQSSSAVAAAVATTKIELLCSLSRHDGPINIVRFSPDGLHLASGGENGTIIIWSIPLNQRLNNNGRHYWTTVTNENELLYKVAPRCCSDGICDLSWSVDSKRILVGTIDHAIVCLEDDSYDTNHGLHSSSSSSSKSISPDGAGSTTNQQVIQQIQSEWKVVYRNCAEHTHYVQGVSYDPLGVYFASMSCDRTVRILQRRPRKNKKIGIDSDTLNNRIQEQLTGTQLLMVSNKAKQIKFRKTINTDGTVASKQHLFSDESTLESFVRRLAWTTDGAFLITPAALWHTNTTNTTVQDPKAKLVHYATLMFARHRFDEPYRVLGGLDKPSIAVRANPVLFQIPPSVTDDDKENESPAKRNTTSYKTLPYRTIFAVLTLDSVLIYDTHHMVPLSVIRGIHYANIVDATWSSDGYSLLVCSTDCFVTVIRFAPGELGQVYVKPKEVVPAQTPLMSKTMTASSIVPTEAVASVSPDSVSSNRPTSNNTNKSTTKLSSPNAIRLPPCEPGPIDAIVASPPKRAKTRITPTLIAVPVTIQKTVQFKITEDDKTGTSASTKTNTTTTAATTTSTCSTIGTVESPKKVLLKRHAPVDDDAPPTDAVDKLSLGSGIVPMDEEGNDKNVKNIYQPHTKKQKKRIQPTLIAQPLL